MYYGSKQEEVDAVTLDPYVRDKNNLWNLAKIAVFSFLILCLTIIGGCDQQATSTTGKDGYKFGEPAFVKTTTTVNLVVYDSKAALLKALKAENKKEFDDSVEAFSVLIPSKNICEMHIVDPKVLYYPEFVGHELYHCFYGQFHNDNNSF